MRSRVLIFIVLALTLAFATMHFMQNRIDQVRRQAGARRPAPGTSVLVAASDLASGTVIAPTDWRWQVWPNGSIDSNYLRQGRNDPQNFTGAVLRSRVAAGEPITLGMLIKPGEGGFLAALLDPGMRAVSVPLNPISDDGGLVRPGDHVDLLLTHAILDPDAPNAPPRIVSETVAVNLRVLAIDENINDQDKKPNVGKTITLEVSPGQARRVEVAKMLGNLSLSLRSVGITQTADVQLGSHTWDSDVSPLIRHEPSKPQQPALTILRGDAGQTAAAAAPAASGTGAGDLTAATRSNS